MSDQQHRLKLLMGCRVGLTGLHQVFTLEQAESITWVRGQSSRPQSGQLVATWTEEGTMRERFQCRKGDQTGTLASPTCAPG